MMVVPIVIPGGGGSTGEPIVVADYADLIARYPAAESGSVFRTGDWGIAWLALYPGSFMRFETPAISDPAYVPTAGPGESFGPTCVLTISGVGVALGDGLTGWAMQVIEVGVAPFNVAPWITAGLTFAQGLAMYDGSATRWSYDGNGPSWARVTTPRVALLADMPSPGAYETFADGDLVVPALSCVCAETGFNYIWSGVAWTLP